MLKFLLKLTGTNPATPIPRVHSPLSPHPRKKHQNAVASSLAALAIMALYTGPPAFLYLTLRD